MFVGSFVSLNDFCVFERLLSSRTCMELNILYLCFSGKLTCNILKPGFLSDEQQTALETILADIVELEMELFPISKDLLQHLKEKDLFKKVVSNLYNTVGSLQSERASTSNQGSLEASNQHDLFTDSVSKDSVKGESPDEESKTNSMNGQGDSDLVNQASNSVKSSTSNPTSCWQNFLNCDFPCVKKLTDLDSEFHRIMQNV